MNHLHVAQSRQRLQGTNLVNSEILIARALFWYLPQRVIMLMRQVAPKVRAVIYSARLEYMLSDEMDDRRKRE
jgi:hypothetical protein